MKTSAGVPKTGTNLRRLIDDHFYLRTQISLSECGINILFAHKASSPVFHIWNAQETICNDKKYDVASVIVTKLLTILLSIILHWVRLVQCVDI